MLAVCAAWGQDNPFNRPPKEVDDALRARVLEFFQYHVTGEYRKAEAMVAEDTRDYFYDHSKPKYMSVEITRIDYSDNFTKAKAVVVCEQRLSGPGFGNQVFKVPTPSAWKLEDGKWVWWVPVETRNVTPFGKMTAGPEPAKGGAAPAIPAVIDNIDFLFKQVRVNKQEVVVPPGGSDTATIENGAPGAMTLSVTQAPVGIDAKLSKTTIESGEKAILTIANKKDGQPGTVRLMVDPIGQIFTINVKNK
jgi:hypothetical protein